MVIGEVNQIAAAYLELDQVAILIILGIFVGVAGTMWRLNGRKEE